MKIIRYFVFALFVLVVFNCQHNDEKLENDSVLIPYATLNGIKIKYFMYQIQGLEDKASIDLLADKEYDMLIIEPGFNLKEDKYDVEYMINKLKTKPNGDKRILLAYIDIGQAEDYRDYWHENWIAPTEDQNGSPDFLITIDPDGWSGNYPVAYWDKRWQNIWLSDDGLIKKIANYGFDGVYLDWVEAYDDEKIREYADKKGINTENEMMLFIEGIRKQGKAIKSDFLVISQNAQYLLDYNPNYYSSLIDGIATEDTWFYGEGDAEWDSSDAGDLQGGERHSEEYSTESRIAQNKKYLSLGIPVFTVDYCISIENAKFVYDESRKNGFIPLVTRVSLSKITETPPF